MKRKRRWLGTFFLLGIGMLMGLFVGSVINAHSGYEEHVIVHTDWTEADREFAFSEDRLAPQVEIVAPEMPGMPEIREISSYRFTPPDYIEIVHSKPSLFQWFRALSNTVAGVALIGMGVWLLAKRRQSPVEKPPQA